MSKKTVEIKIKNKKKTLLHLLSLLLPLATTH